MKARVRKSSRSGALESFHEPCMPTTEGHRTPPEL
jgi:hypothetical protein